MVRVSVSLLKNVGRFVSTGTGKFGPSRSALGSVTATVPEEPTFYHKDLAIQQATPAQMRPKPPPDAPLKFGHQYADHMAEIEWTIEGGWETPRINPMHNLSLHPGAKVLHYAIELFEGMKAYRGVDNKIRLFRPDLNMERMRRTAHRAGLPTFDAEELTKVIVDLVKLDQEWVPHSTTSSLYIRPTFIGTDPTLGVGFSRAGLLYVLTGPAGQYYATGFQPVSLLADSEFVRAFPGGVGGFKMGCNYAPTILISKMAGEMGCQQVLWLYDDDEKLTEVGTMNIFAYWINEQGERELVTPPLAEGLILPGVTRQSLLDLAREWNEFKVSERFLTMGEVRKAIKEGRMMEMFGAGTACVVSPVGNIVYKNRAKGVYEDLQIPTMENSPNLMQRFFETITDIQYGRISRPGWMRTVTE